MQFRRSAMPLRINCNVWEISARVKVARPSGEDETEMRSSEESKTINEWAEFWRYDIGVNVIPADTRRKVTYESWAEWQDKPISEELYNEWKASGAFNNGIAIIIGKVWHNPHKTGLYLIGIDLDNRKAIEEICSRNGNTISLLQLSQWTLVEQHLDDPSKAHVLIYSQKPFPKKSSDTHSLSDKFKAMKFLQ